MSDSNDSLDLHAITEEDNIRLRHRVKVLEAAIRDTATFLDETDHPYPSTACPEAVCSLCRKADELRELAPR